MVFPHHARKLQSQEEQDQAPRPSGEIHGKSWMNQAEMCNSGFRGDIRSPGTLLTVTQPRDWEHHLVERSHNTAKIITACPWRRVIWLIYDWYDLPVVNRGSFSEHPTAGGKVQKTSARHRDLENQWKFRRSTAGWGVHILLPMFFHAKLLRRIRNWAKLIWAAIASSRFVHGVLSSRRGFIPQK